MFAFSCGEKPDATDDSPPQSQNPSTQEPENPTPPVTTEPIEVKVVSFNVRYPADSDTGEQAWDFRFPGICAMIEEVAPDIIGTQECYPSQREEILAAFPKYKAYGVRRSDGIDAIGKSETTSIIYDEERLEIVDKGTFWLSETPDVPSTGWESSGYSRTAPASQKDRRYFSRDWTPPKWWKRRKKCTKKERRLSLPRA